MGTRSVFPQNVPSPGATSHGPCNGLNISQDNCKKREDLLAQGKQCENATTISVLTDNVMLEIFDFYRQNDHDQHLYRVWKWHLLTQVCRRWRQIILASPCRLDLKLLCTDGAPVRKYLGIWPAIPIIVGFGPAGCGISPNDEDNVIAALEHPDRVCRVRLDIKGSQLGKIATVIQQPFPVLTRLMISSEDDQEDDSEPEDRNFPVLPDGFLSGSAPCLREFELVGISFPTLPKLLLSARDLVELNLTDIPPTGYISPEVMVAHLATLPRLEIFDIGFKSVTFRPDQMLLPPKTRTILPALRCLFISGVGYSEDFLARIDTPQLDSIELSYSDQFVELTKFINRSENLKDILSSQCRIMLDDYNDAFSFFIGDVTNVKNEHCNSRTGIDVDILCEGVDQQILQLTHVFSCISPILSNMIHFTINSEWFFSESDHLDELDVALDDLDDIQWVRLLRPFSSVQTLFVSWIIARQISRMLEDMAVDSEVTVIQLLPALELLCLEDQPLSSVDEFIAVRQNSGHPVTIVNTKRKSDQKLKSYPY